MQSLISVTSATLEAMALSEQVSKGERTRAALICAAIRRFASEGYHRVSLTDIARDVGVSPTAVYRYFPDKEALFEAAVDTDAEALVAFARDALTRDVGGSLLELLGRLAAGLVTAAHAHPLVARVLGRSRHHDAGPDPRAADACRFPVRARRPARVRAVDGRRAP